MPAPEVQLLQSLTEHQTLGCITGLFHIFEGHPAFMGRTRVGNGQAQIKTQVVNQPHRYDHRDNPFSKHYQSFDIHKKAEQSAKHSRSQSDVTDFAMTPSRAFQDANRCGLMEPTPACSEGTADAYRRAAVLLVGDSRQDRGDQDNRRKVVSGRDHAELATNAYPDQGAGLMNGSHGCHRGSASPRSSSFYARASPHEPSKLLNWKEGLRSSTASPPRKLSHHNSPERRVEPKKYRGRSDLSKDQYSMSPKRFQQAGPLPQVPRHGDRFKESPGASEFRESLRPFLTEPQNVAAQESSFASRSTGSSHESYQVPNVIARLMGLEETIPSSAQQKAAPDAKSRGEKFFRGLVQFDPQIMRPTSPPPPPPCRYIAQRHQDPTYRSIYPAQYKLEQELCSSEEDRDYEHFNSRPFVCEHREGLPPATEDTTTVAPEKKKRIFRKILEAMRPRALLKISRRKQMEQEKPPVSKLNIKDVVQPVEELLEEHQPIKVVTSMKFLPEVEDQPLRYSVSDTSSVKMQEQQTESSKSSESSVVKRCVLQRPDDVVMKDVDTASTSASTEKEIMAPTRRTALDWNQRRVMKPGTPPQSVRARSKSVESDYESDPSSCGKPSDVRESGKMRTTTARKRDPSSKSPTPDRQRRCSSPGKDQCKTSEVGGRSAVAKDKKGSRAAQDLTLKKRVTDDSRLYKSSLDSKPAHNKPTRSIKGTGAPKKLDVCRSSTTDVDTYSNGLNPAFLPPASAQPQMSDSEPILETVQPVPRRSIVNIIDTSPEVPKTAEVSQGDHILDNASDAIPQPLLQAQEATLVEELTTPRGIPLHCEKLDAELDEGKLDRPSPISVLDINTFEEELTPSPKSPRHSFPILQDSETRYNDEGYESPDKGLGAYHETPEDDLNFDGLFSRYAEELRVQIEETDRLDKFKDDGESLFVETLLSETPEAATINSAKTKTPPEAATIVSDKTTTEPEAAINFGQTKRQLQAAINSGKAKIDLLENINESLLESLRSNGTLQENNHILLLDCLEEIMERILESHSDRWCPELTTKGKQLEQELWTELRDVPPSDDICETVHRLLQRDLIKRHGQQWSTFSKDREQIGVEIEKLILEDLVEDVVRDLCALQVHMQPNSLPRRQLFTN